MSERNETSIVIITMRDYFAAHAPDRYRMSNMPGSMAFREQIEGVKDIAQWRYAYADAMLAERER